MQFQKDNTAEIYSCFIFFFTLTTCKQYGKKYQNIFFLVYFQDDFAYLV